MNTSIKYFLHRHHYMIIFVILILTFLCSIGFYVVGEDWKTTIPVIGFAISLIYIVEKQQLEEAILFRQLFTDFNSRYDKLNESLNLIKNDTSTKLSDEKKECLFDYFNLCGEEYLFYKSGYIYPQVWRSWVMGMKIFYDNQQIKEIWDKELTTSSYYGLDVNKEIRKSIKYLNK